MMTKKNYEAISQILRDHRESVPPFKRSDILIFKLVDYLEQDNPRFNKMLFLKKIFQEVV